MKRDSQEHEAVVRVQRERKYEVGGRGIRDLKARVRQKCYISRGGQIEKWRYTS